MLDKGKHYEHITFAEREYIAKAIGNESVASIAIYLNKSRQAIYREIKQGTINGCYDPQYAQQRSVENGKKKGQRPLIERDNNLPGIIRKMFREEHLSVLKVAERLQGKVSRATLYQWIYEGKIPGVGVEHLWERITMRKQPVLYVPEWVRKKYNYQQGSMFLLEVREDGTLVYSPTKANEK